MHKNCLEEIASNRELKGRDLRVLLLLLAHIQEGTTTEISQVEMAKTLGVESSAVCNAIKKLCDNKIINKKYIAGKLVGYQLILEEETLSKLCNL